LKGVNQISSVCSNDNRLYNEYLAELLDCGKEYLHQKDIDEISRAYDYAYSMHKGQIRRSGDEFIEHPVQVAKILAENSLDPTLIVAALLHDTIEDTESQFKDLNRIFGREIAEIVDGVTKLDKLKLSSSVDERKHNAQRLMLAVAADERVILVKLADRLHNMKTIQHMTMEKQRAKAKETLYFYAPVADQLGLFKWREELEDLCFEVLYPDARIFVINHISKVTGERVGGKETSGQIVEEVRTRIENNLALKGLKDFSVTTRIKRPYSVWRKMRREKMSVSKIADILGVRIITKNEEDVYTALGVVHYIGKAVFARFKDYNSLPKENGYRSVHTTITHMSGCQIEVQIRSKLMHEVAEIGIAAHWVHHEHNLVKNPYIVRNEWQNSLQNLVSGQSARGRQFYKSFRENILSRSVYCFAPNSDVIWLPKGATVLDFAYELGQDNGDHAMHAYVDMHRVPLNTPVKDGQTINVITSTIPFVNEAKLKSATTEAAKQHVRNLHEYLNAQNEISQGILYLKQSFAKHGKSYTGSAIRTAMELLKHTDENELLRKVGRKEIHTSVIFNALYPFSSLQDRDDIEEPGQLFINLADGEIAEMAKCCLPVPLEQVIGVRKDDSLIHVHLPDCTHVSSSKELVKVQWHHGPFAAVHPTRIAVRMSNLPGVLGRVCTIIGESESNINDLRIMSRKHDFFDFTIELEVKDKDHLAIVMNAVETVDETLSVDRHHNGGHQDDNWH